MYTYLHVSCQLRQTLDIKSYIGFFFIGLFFRNSFVSIIVYPLIENMILSYSFYIILFVFLAIERVLKRIVKKAPFLSFHQCNDKWQVKLFNIQSSFFYLPFQFSRKWLHNTVKFLKDTIRRTTQSKPLLCTSICDIIYISLLIQYSLKIIRWFFTLSELSIDCYFKTGFSLYAINCLGKLSIIFKSSHWRCFIKKVFLTICQNSQEYTCAKVSFFNKVAGLKPATLLKKRLWHSCFSVTFKKLLRTPFLQDTSV